jgi:uncharacterized protein (TIRG00374 family)
MTDFKRLLRQLLFWGLPVAIFYIVFRKVDFDLLKANLLRADLPWIVFGLVVYPLAMVLGGSRWNYQLRTHISDQITLAQTIKFYWMGYPFTLFFPSGLGWDAHRTLVSGQKYGRFTMNIGVIVVEKIIALIATMLLIVMVYPFTLSHSISAAYQQVFNFALLFLLLMLLALGITSFLLKYRFTVGLFDRVDKYFTGKIRATLTKIGVNDRFDSANTSIRDFLSPLVNPRCFGLVLIYSIAIQIASAFAAQLFFIAVGYDIPFAVNLFVVPFIFLALVLPISFGGLGIREAAFIILYGQFGVPVEVALVVSFFTLMGILLNYTIGGIMLSHHGTQ